MCPICWINGVLFFLFGASALSYGTEWYVLMPSFILFAYGGYKIWEGIKKGKHFSDDQKTNSKKTIRRFAIGVAVGVYTGFAITFAFTSAEHERMHDLLEQQGIKDPYGLPIHHDH